MTPARDEGVLLGLGRLEAALMAGGAPVVEHLRPGRSADTVDDGLEAAGMRGTSDVVAWFGWHDGCSSSHSYGPDRGFLPYHHPFSGLDDILAWRTGQHGRDVLEHEREMRGWRPEDVLPFLSDLGQGQAVGYAVREGDQHRVWVGILEAPDYDDRGTLAEFVDVLATAWQTGVVRYDADDDELVLDEDAFAVLLDSRPADPGR